MRYAFLETMCDVSHYAPLAQAAEAAGFEEFAMADSIIYPKESSTHYPYLSSGDREFIGAAPVLDPMVLAMHMAAQTQSIEFVSFVLKLAVRNPVLVAKQAASVAALSNNRLKLGLGLSPWPEDFQVCGAEWKRRGKRMDEQIEILRKAMSGEYFSYEGEFHQIPELKMNPGTSKPMPLYVGGHSEAALKRAALLGDGWMHAGGDKDDPLPLIKRLQEIREEHGVADKPFAIYIISMDAYTPEGIAKLEAAGVTHVVVGFRNVYDPASGSMGVQEKIDMLNGYAETVIKPSR